MSACHCLKLTCVNAFYIQESLGTLANLKIIVLVELSKTFPNLKRVCVLFIGYRKVFHEGVYSSYNCRMTLLPDVSIGVWVCTTSPSGRTGNFPSMLVHQFAVDLLLGEWGRLSVKAISGACFIGQNNLRVF